MISALLDTALGNVVKNWEMWWSTDYGNHCEAECGESWFSIFQNCQTAPNLGHPRHHEHKSCLALRQVHDLPEEMEAFLLPACSNLSSFCRMYCKHASRWVCLLGVECQVTFVQLKRQSSLATGGPSDYRYAQVVNRWPLFKCLK